MSAFDTVTENLSSLTISDLYELSHMIAALIAVREREQEADQEAPTAASKSAAQGCIEMKWIPGKGGKQYGPYAYLRYRSGGKLKSKYLKGYHPAQPGATRPTLQSITKPTDAEQN